MITFIQIEWYRVILKYWLFKVNQDEQRKLPNIYNINKMTLYTDKIMDLHFKKFK